MGESLRNYQTVPELKNNQSAKHEVLKQSTTASYPFLIKVTHNDEVFRFARYFEDVVFNNEVYVASDFLFNPPEEGINGIQDASLTISDVEQFWTERLRNANTFDTITIEFVAVIVFDGENVMNICEIESIMFTVKNVTGNGIGYDISLSFDEKMNINIPCDVMDSVKCAGCA